MAVNDQQGSTSAPASGQNSGGTYKADLTTTMVRVYITGGTIGTLLTLGGNPVEITIARATAHSEHQQTPLSDTTAPTQAVSGHAFIASAQVDPLVPTATAEYVEIPVSGRHRQQGRHGSRAADRRLDRVDGGRGGELDWHERCDIEHSVELCPDSGACVLRLAVSSGCLISATLIRSQANSSATASARSSNATGTEFTNLKVAGISIAGTPPPNTTITLPLGLGFVVLNEQVPDGPETGHTGLTVRGLRVVVTLPLSPLLAGAEVIVAQGHSDAAFR